MTLPAEQSVVAQSTEAIRKGSKSFSAAARLFDARTREDCVMLYAWCRHCDDVIDGQTLGHDQREDFRVGQRERLETLRAETRVALDGAAEPAEPVFQALRSVAQRTGLPAKYAFHLLDGFAMDVEERRYETVADTLDYGYHVAGCVGVMMAVVMGVSDDETLDRASDLGIAFQLTNIARDVIDDARAGRTYLPRELLAEQGITEIEPDDRAQWPLVHAAALKLLDIAEPYYASAHAGMSRLPPRSAWAIGAARRVYRAIGEKLRKGGPEAWEQRVSTSTFDKLVLLSLGGVDVIGTRRPGDGPARTGLYQRPG
jgi:phytoene synthase